MYCRGTKLRKCVYCPVQVLFLFMFLLNDPSDLLVKRTSKKANRPSLSSSDVNWMAGCTSFTSEEESDGRLAFLDVLLTKRSDGSLRRNMNRKSTWTGQYTHFLSFVPLQYKRNLIKTLSYRIRTICSADVVDNELNTLHNALRENGYPRKFIIKYMIFKVKIGEFQTVKKKSLFMRLQFRGMPLAKYLLRDYADLSKNLSTQVNYVWCFLRVQW